MVQAAKIFRLDMNLGAISTLALECLREFITPGSHQQLQGR